MSVCRSSSNKRLIDAQRSIIKANNNVFQSINTDKLGNKYRYDGCHFNSLGANEIGEKYAYWIDKLNY